MRLTISLLCAFSGFFVLPFSIAYAEGPLTTQHCEISSDRKIIMSETRSEALTAAGLTKAIEDRSRRRCNIHYIRDHIVSGRSLGLGSTYLPCIVSDDGFKQIRGEFREKTEDEQLKVAAGIEAQCKKLVTEFFAADLAHLRQSEQDQVKASTQRTKAKMEAIPKFGFKDISAETQLADLQKNPIFLCESKLPRLTYCFLRDETSSGSWNTIAGEGIERLLVEFVDSKIASININISFYNKPGAPQRVVGALKEKYGQEDARRTGESGSESVPNVGPLREALPGTFSDGEADGKSWRWEWTRADSTMALYDIVRVGEERISYEDRFIILYSRSVLRIAYLPYAEEASRVKSSAIRRKIKELGEAEELQKKNEAMKRAKDL